MKKLLLYIAFLCLSNVYSQCFTKISAGYSHSLGLKPDGTLWGWGLGEYGQLSTGNDSDSSIPILCGTATNWAKICGGYSNTFAIKNDGTLWGTGYNLYGALGINSTVDHTSVLTQIGTANNWMEVAAGETFAIGLRADHTMWAWGFNQYFELGDGTTIQRNSPVQIGTTADWKTICSSKLDCSFAIKTNGTLWAWGTNVGSVLGDDSVSAWSVPTLRDISTNWDKFALGIGNHVMALKTDHTLWAWGLGDFGQTGHDPNSTYGNSQLNQIPGLWSAMAVGGDKFSMGIKTDGTLWAWGNNNIGQLGDGGDRYRTAALNLSVSDISIGFNLMTGKRDLDYEKDNLPSGYKGGKEFGIKDGMDRNLPNGAVHEVGKKYRLGVLSIGYKGYKLGVNSEKIRHAIQNHTIHNLSFNPFGIPIINKAQRGFENQSWKWSGYFQYKTPNNFTSW